VVVVLQEGRAGGVRGESTTDKDIKQNKTRCQVNVAAIEGKGRSLKTNSAEICNSFWRGCLFFIRQICNFNQNRVEGCRNVPLGLLLLPLITRKRKKDFKKKKKKEYDICQFSRKVMAHQPADTIATAFRMTSMLVRPTVLLEWKTACKKKKIKDKRGTAWEYAQEGRSLTPPRLVAASRRAPQTRDSVDGRKQRAHAPDGQ
jgi:hypothetical protein